MNLARSVLVPLVVVASGLSVAVTAPTPASAATDSCVSRAEYTRVKQGMTVPRVRQVVGFNGRSLGRVAASQDYVIEKRRYRLCASSTKIAELGFVSVRNGPFKLTRKQQVPR